MTARPMTLGTFCSGIGAPECAGMGKPLWFCEIEPFPSAVLAHHFPSVPNLGDMTAPDLLERIAAVGMPDIVVAGLPCQPFSVAGLRKGLEDPRNLTVRFVEIADAIDDLRRAAGQRSVWWCVENVPGLLSDADNAFGALLGGLVGDDAAIDRPAGGWTNAGVVAGPRRVAAWRVLDARHFGVAQRRRRVFVLALGGAGAWACADALLPIAQSLSGHPAPSREKGQRVARPVAAGSPRGSGYRNDADTADNLIPDVALCLNAHPSRIDGESETFIAHALRAEGFDGGEDGTGRGTPLVPISFTGGASNILSEIDMAQPVTGRHGDPGMVAFDTTQITSKSNYSNPQPGDPCHPLAAGAHAPALASTTGVRRIVPVEAERLQGFPDGYTAILYRGKPAADGPRYKALGNSMAVPCMAYIGERIRTVDAAMRAAEASEAA